MNPITARPAELQTVKSVWRAAWRLLPHLCAIAASSLVAGPAAADNAAYGCPQTVVRGSDVYVQGSEGVFFRLKPDLDVYFPLSDHYADKVAELSRLLARNGTTLIMLPVPARGTAMASHLRDLPPDATMGFDPVLARASYEAIISKLRNRGINAVDLLEVLQTGAAGPDYFLPVDHHWNAAGSETAAHSVAEIVNAEAGKLGITRTEFETRPAGRQMIISEMRRDIQLFCDGPVPLNMVNASETLVKVSDGQGGQLDIFGEAGKSAQIALAGTSFSDVDAFNFSGFISQFTGLDVVNVAISGGNQFTSILSYVTSSAFADSPPRFLVWENPVYNNLGEMGDQPFDELMAAGGGTCEGKTSMKVPVAAEAELARVEFSPALDTHSAYFKLDTGDVAVRSVTIDMKSSDGSTLPLEIRRPDRFRSSGRFYFKADAESLSSITIRMNGAQDPGKATLTICNPATN